MPALPSEAAGFGHRHSLDALTFDRFLHLVQLEGLDDRRYDLHFTPFTKRVTANGSGRAAASVAAHPVPNGRCGFASPGGDAIDRTASAPTSPVRIRNTPSEPVTH